MPVVVVAVATESQCEFVVIIAFCITIYSDILTDRESVFDIIVGKIGIVVGFVMCDNFNICPEFLAIFFLYRLRQHFLCLYQNEGSLLSPSGRSPCMFS